MKYYPSVLVVLRFFAVGVAALALYYLVMSWVAFGAGSADDSSHGKMMQRGKEASLNHGLAILGIGFGLYVTSPLLARLITWGSDVGSGRQPRD